MPVRRIVWRTCYELLAKRVPTPGWAFMNYGYVPTAGDLDAPPWTPTDERDRLCIQLYLHAIGGTDLTGRDVLEVGSGRGGGASYISRRLQPQSMTGLDFSGKAVDLCNRHRRVPGLAFVCGDALSMPFPDASFDAVVNIESSHCYEDMGQFLSEVNRVLRPGGRLLLRRPAQRGRRRRPPLPVRLLRLESQHGDRHHAQRPRRPSARQCAETWTHRGVDSSSLSPADARVRRDRRNHELHPAGKRKVALPQRTPDQERSAAGVNPFQA